MTIPESTRPLDVYDMAVLAGGLPRLVDTAIVAMVESGRVRVDSSGEFHAEAPSSRHPVEAAVLDAIGSRGYRSVDGIGSRFLHDRRLDDAFRHLTRDGLVRRGIAARLVGKTHAHTTAAGRRALQQFAEQPVSEGGSAVQVALHGRDAMSDHRLRAEIFDRAPVVLPPRSASRNPRVPLSERGVPHRRLAHQGGAAAAAGGLTAYGAGTLDGGAGSGGGDGGGGGGGG